MVLPDPVLWKGEGRSVGSVERRTKIIKEGMTSNQHQPFLVAFSSFALPAMQIANAVEGIATFTLECCKAQLGESHFLLLAASAVCMQAGGLYK